MSKKICVFGSFSDGLDEALIENVTALCRSLGEAGFGLVFGGFSGGLMKASADGFSQAGAEIVGVVPRSMLGKGRIVHEGCTEVVETADLDERKKNMVERADIILSVPGGVGTLDELLGVMAQKIVGECQKPIVLYDVDGFYAPFVAWMEQLHCDGYIRVPLDGLYFASDDARAIVDYLKK